MAVKIRKPCGDDAVVVAAGMRDRDVDEVLLMSGLGPLSGILVSMEDSAYKHLWCAEDHDGVFCVGGCSIDGAPWLLATPTIEKYTVLLTKTSIKMINKMHLDYPTLTNWVDARNLQSIEWLQRLGFAISDTDDPRIKRFSKCSKQVLEIT